MSAASRDREETIPDRQQPASPNDQIQIALIGAGIQGTGDTATWTQTYDNQNVGTGKTLTAAGTGGEACSGGA